MSIKNKLFFGNIIPVFCLGVGILVFINIIFEKTLLRELTEKGVAIVHNLSVQSPNLILTDDIMSLHRLIDDVKEETHDITYIFIADKKGRPFIHTFAEGFPADLLGINPIKEEKGYSIQLIEAEGEIIQDIAVPILKGKLGSIHVGMNERSIKEKVAYTVNVLLAFLLIALILGLIITYLIEIRLIQPIFEIASMARAVGNGDLEKHVEIKTKDEIGELAASFNQMTVNLKKAMDELEVEKKSLEQKVHERTQELEKANVELKTRAEELEAVNKELDSFTYSASHDLKEPLRGIESFSNFLLEDYADKLDETGKDYLKRVSAAAVRMKFLIDDLLSLSKISRIKNPHTSVDSNKLVKEVLKQLKPIIEEKNVRVKVDEDLPFIYCDEVKIRQVFYNLISNAIKYNDKKQPELEIGIEKMIVDGISQTVFFVRDNGIGIEEKHFEEIFGIFKRLHPRGEHGEGTGVGLAIVKRVIADHGGKVWVQSTYGEGSTFYFSLR